MLQVTPEVGAKYLLHEKLLLEPNTLTGQDPLPSFMEHVLTVHKFFRATEEKVCAVV